MSPASRSKSKDKKVGKESEKTPIKSSGLMHSINGPTSGYNPVLGKFHALETSNVTTPLSINSSGRFRNIDETEDQITNSLGTGLDFDAASNNGSWSGESEDTKDKTSSHNQALRQEPVPGADNEKREKIRQKNERKHQRQKERRAQELHERCSGFLMSRKLEALSQQLVAMGFSSERATMALILNEGKIEESVAWLLEGGIEDEEETDRYKEANLNGGTLKIDITEELARIVDMEVKYNCSKQEVERAVVACEGDIDKAAETLRLPKEELPSAPPKIEESLNDHSKFPILKIQPRPSSLSTHIQQQQPTKEEKDFNYTKSVPNGVLPIVAPKLEWAKPQQISTVMERRWTNNPPSASTLPIQVNPPVKIEVQSDLVSNELKHLQLGSIKEPVVVMQRQSHQVGSNQKQVESNVSSSSSSPSPLPPAGSWQQNNYNNNIGAGMVKPGQLSSSFNNSRPRIVSGSDLQYHQQQYQHQQMVEDQNRNQNQGNNHSWNPMVGMSTRTLSAASSLGLFPGLGSNGSWSSSSSSVDWNTSSSMYELDYASVDWSLDRGDSRSPGMWKGVGGGQHNNNQVLGSGRPDGPPMKQMPTTNGHHGGVGGMTMAGGVGGGGPSSTSGVGGGSSKEWSSPFEEKDMFGLSRKFVTSPSL